MQAASKGIPTTKGKSGWLGGEMEIMTDALRVLIETLIPLTPGERTWVMESAEGALELIDEEKRLAEIEGP